MDYLSKIRTVFSPLNIKISERVKCLELSFEVSSLPEYNEILSIIKDFPDRDVVRIVLKDETEASFMLGSKHFNLELEYRDYISETSTSDLFSISFTIDKNIVDNKFSIYDSDLFFKDICTLSTSGILDTFSLLLDGLEYLNFIIYDKPYTFMTRTMCFSSEENCEFHSDVSRIKRIGDCNDVSRFTYVKKLNLIPDDFKIVVDNLNSDLSNCFRKINSLLSIAFISTSASFDGVVLSTQITGQRSLSNDINVNCLKENNELYKIYNWIFTDGNATDKAIIARNVISLHCRYINLLDIDELAFSSIQSNYNLYLKNNVGQYLELKNDIADYICNVISKTSEHATIILDKFKQNLVALIGFVFTTIIANIVSTNPLDNIFTRDITLILYAVLAGSIVFLIVSIIETNYKCKNMEKSYWSLKDNYMNVLSKDDITDVFKNDNILLDAKKEIKNKTKLFSIIWFIFILLSFVFTEFISTNPVLLDDIIKYIENFKIDDFFIKNK